MPAILLARLRIQVAKLVEDIPQPELFTRNLRDLFEFYADRISRPGEVSATSPIIPTYHVAPPILREIEKEISGHPVFQGETALHLIDILWQDKFFEPRLLAVRLLGKLSIESPDHIIERIRSWARPDEEKQLLDAIIANGMESLRHEKIELFLALVQEWLNSLQPTVQSIGLRSLLPLLKDASFENLPVIYRLLVPILNTAPSILHNDLLEIIRVLVQRSPVEAVHLLREVATKTNNPNTRRLIRRSLNLLPPSEQNSLRADVY